MHEVLTQSRPSGSSVKVMRFITRMNLGGPALHVGVLSSQLELRGYESVLVSGVCEAEEGDLPAPEPAGGVIKLHHLSRSIAPVRDLVAIVTAYRVIRRECPLIVHTHTAKAGTVGRIAACLAGVPIVVHTYHGNSLSGYFSPAVNFAMRMIERLLAKITDRICVVTNQQFEEIHGQFGVGKASQYRVVPLGVDLSRELELALPEEGKSVITVGWLGRFVDVKRVSLLLSVIQTAADLNLPVRFMIGGDGPQREMVRATVERLGPRFVSWEGWQTDPTAFLGGCDVLFQTSRNEGTPVALIQGMAAGRPFVSTAVGGVVDLVYGTGSPRSEGGAWYANGVLVEPTVSAFIEALRCFCEQQPLIPQMGAAARQFAAGRFQADRLGADMDHLYRDLLQRHPAYRQQRLVWR